MFNVHGGKNTTFSDIVNTKNKKVINKVINNENSGKKERGTRQPRLSSLFHITAFAVCYQL